MKETLTRKIVGKDIVYVDRGTSYNYYDIIDLINRWHRVFDHLNLTNGDRVAVFDTQTIEHISLIIAIGERRLQYYATQRDCFIDPNRNFDYVKKNIKAVFVRLLDIDDDLAQDFSPCYWNLTQFNVSDVKKFSPKSQRNYGVLPTDTLIVSTTSGTTGEPKEFTHSHKSVLSASYTSADLFYNKKDKILLYTTLNHVGVITVQVLPVIIAGCKIFGHYKFEGSSILQKLKEYRPNKTILFPLNLAQMKFDPIWNEMSLEFLEEVISGGGIIKKSFVNELLNKGVKQIHNVYGLSEALPPVFVSTITTDNIDVMYYEDNPESGSLVSDWKIKRSNAGNLLIKGTGLATAEWLKNKSTDDGYYDTSDKVLFDNNKYYIIGRAAKMLRYKDVLINASEIEERILGMHLEIDKVKILVNEHDQLVVGLCFHPTISADAQQHIKNLIFKNYQTDLFVELKNEAEADQIKELTRIVNNR